MRAVRSTGVGVEVVEVPEPEGPGELLTMRSASICGSDFGYIAAGSRFILGHELAGTTSDGRPVAIEAVFACGHCDQCVAGTYHRCRHHGRSRPRPDRSTAGCPTPSGRPPRASSRCPRGSTSATPRWSSRRPSPGTGAPGGDCGAGGWRSSEAAHRPAARWPRPWGPAPTTSDWSPATPPRWRRVSASVPARRRASTTSSSSRGRLRELDRAAGRAGRAGWHRSSCSGCYGGLLPLPFIPALMKEVRVVPSITYSVHGGHRDFDEAAALLARRPEIGAVAHHPPVPARRRRRGVPGGRRPGQRRDQGGRRALAGRPGACYNLHVTSCSRSEHDTPTGSSRWAASTR